MQSLNPVYFPADTSIDVQISSIRRLIRASMNGVVADEMRAKGLVYHQNFGVDLPRLREIATLFAPSLPLAERLWAIAARETMILAFALAPSDSTPVDTTLKWLQSLPTNEMAETGSLLFFPRLPYVAQLVMDFSLDQPVARLAMLLTAVRVHTRLSDHERQRLLNHCLTHLDADNFSICHATGILLGNMAVIHTTMTDAIVTAVAPLANSPLANLRTVYDRVQQEVVNS
ncbi:MAG: hypothetical protein LBS16_01840 [Prevotellaceae bacterium]|jgi:hypothetical protein|nr:hypothetical protein [Prevotellaceae bacterium]